MKLHSIDGLTQVGYSKQRQTVLVGAVCDYLDSFTLPFNPEWGWSGGAMVLGKLPVPGRPTYLE